MVFKNSKLYDILKWVFSVVLPASTALTTFGCALLGISSVTYHKKLESGESK